MFLPSAIVALQNSIDLILKDPILKGASYSITISQIDGKTLYKKNSGLQLTPASNQKILITLYALDQLGSNFKPQTNFWKEGEYLYIESKGDPSLTTSQLLDIKKKLDLNENTTVRVKQSYMVRPTIPYWEIDDLDAYYAAPITALTLDEGTFSLPISKNISLSNIYRLKSVIHKKNVAIDHPSSRSITYNMLKRRLEIIDQYPLKNVIVKRLPIKRPDKAVALILGNKFETTETVPNISPTYVHYGNPIMDLCAYTQKTSSNLYAENLLHMAAQNELKTEKINLTQATHCLKNFAVNKIGLDPKTIKCSDGSGLSRHNLMTTKNLSKIWLWATKQPYWNAYKLAQCRPGELGFLNNRLHNYNFYGKTGSFDLCSSLSGVLDLPNKKSIIFCMIINNANTSLPEIRNVIDKTVKACKDTLNR